MRRAAELFAEVDGIERVLTGDALTAAGLAHPRSGQVVLLARPDRWFAYYWWFEPGKAPPIARTADFGRKPGADPMELFINPRIKAIDFDVNRIRGSYGVAGADPNDRPVFAVAGGRTSGLPFDGEVDARAVAGIIDAMLQ